MFDKLTSNRAGQSSPEQPSTVLELSKATALEFLSIDRMQLSGRAQSALERILYPTIQQDLLSGKDVPYPALSSCLDMHDANYASVRAVSKKTYQLIDETKLIKDAVGGTFQPTSDLLLALQRRLGSCIPNNTTREEGLLSPLPTHFIQNATNLVAQIEQMLNPASLKSGIKPEALQKQISEFAGGAHSWLLQLEGPLFEIVCDWNELAKKVITDLHKQRWGEVTASNSSPTTPANKMAKLAGQLKELQANDLPKLRLNGNTSDFRTLVSEALSLAVLAHISQTVAEDSKKLFSLAAEGGGNSSNLVEVLLESLGGMALFGQRLSELKAGRLAWPEFQEMVSPTLTDAKEKIAAISPRLAEECRFAVVELRNALEMGLASREEIGEMLAKRACTARCVSAVQQFPDSLFQIFESSSNVRAVKLESTPKVFTATSAPTPKVAQTPTDAKVQGFIELARQKHVDISLRNPLVNFRGYGGKRNLEILGESGVEVLKILSTQRQMSFANRDQGEDSLVTVITKALLTDDRLETPYRRDELEERLWEIYTEACRRSQEYGESCLYVGIGMVEYPDSEDPKKNRQGPLILMPVDISRTTVWERFRIKFTGSVPEINPALKAKLKTLFGVSLPAFQLDKDPESVKAYFTKVQQVLEKKTRIKLNPDQMGLGFFSSARFVMHRDLDPRGWTKGNRTWTATQPVISSLVAGKAITTPEFLPTSDRLDSYMDPARHILVTEADSSQMAALLSQERTALTVFHGPPGTGKSQSIVNLIAWAVAQGQSVLFVAKKKAALDVVRERLNRLGLGDLTLELHSHTTPKTEVIRELKRTFGLAEPIAAETNNDRLVTISNEMNGYAVALNTEIGQSGMTPLAAIERQIGLREAAETQPLVSVVNACMRLWKEEDLQFARVAAEELARRLPALGDPQTNVFYGSLLKDLPEDLRSKLLSTFDAFIDKLSTLENNSRKILNRLNTTTPVSPAEAAEMLRHLLQAPADYTVLFAATEWKEQKSDIDAAIQNLKTCEAERTNAGAFVRAESFGVDVTFLKTEHLYYRQTWCNWLRPNWYKNRWGVNSLFEPGKAPEKFAERWKTLTALNNWREAHEQAAESLTLVAKLCPGVTQEKMSSSPAAIATALEWGQKMSKFSKGHAPALSTLLETLQREPTMKDEVGKEITELTSSVREFLESRSTLLATLGASTQLDEKFHALSRTDQEALVLKWKNNITELSKLTTLNEMESRFGTKGMTFLFNFALTHPNERAALANSLEHSWVGLMLDWCFRERPILGLSADDLRERRKEFRTEDANGLANNRIELARRVWEQVPRHDVGGQTSALAKEFSKGRSFAEIRELFRAAGNVVQKIKPVIMMSPEAVAKFLPRTNRMFDLLVIDETSQMLVGEALPAMLRAKKFVAVGDPQQMPPAAFFESSQSNEDQAEQDEQSGGRSVLDLMIGRGVQQPMLTTAYRFQHPSLIQHSNYLFYDGGLKVFPSPERTTARCGLSLHHISESIYDRGGTGTNRVEAERIAEEVMRHARETPHLSLGVVALSQAQMNALSKAVEKARKNDASAEAFFNEKADGFFIKNLENVQGDERDVIFVSLGYGRDDAGNTSMNFGPLNKEGGDKRLNVLFSRSRIRTEIFSNLLPEDFKRPHAYGAGVQALHSFLDYAHRGATVKEKITSQSALSPLVASVKKGIERRGFTVEVLPSDTHGPELAIVDPADDTRYALGVITDHGHYEGGGILRDRERLKFECLERLGWKLRHVGAIAWLKDQERELDQIATALKANPSQTASPKEAASYFGITRRGLVTEAFERAPVPEYQRAELHCDLRSEIEPQLRRMILDTVSIEAPVHVDEVSRRIRDETEKNSDSFRDRIAQEIAELVQSGQLRTQDGSFLTLHGKPGIAIRRRSSFPATLRRIGLISPEEIDAAILFVVERSHGVTAAEVCQACCTKLFGFSSVPSDGELIFTAQLNGLLNDGLLRKVDNHLVIGTIFNQQHSGDIGLATETATEDTVAA